MENVTTNGHNPARKSDKCYGNIAENSGRKKPLALNLSTVLNVYESNSRYNSETITILVFSKSMTDLFLHILTTSTFEKKTHTNLKI